jgi:hypothetical protein
MRYGLNLAEGGRILSATYEKYAAPLAVIVDELPEGDISDYRYENGEYIYDPLPRPEPPEPQESEWDILNALLGVEE